VAWDLQFEYFSQGVWYQGLSRQWPHSVFSTKFWASRQALQRSQSI